MGAMSFVPLLSLRLCDFAMVSRNPKAKGLPSKAKLKTRKVTLTRCGNGYPVTPGRTIMRVPRYHSRASSPRDAVHPRKSPGSTENRCVFCNAITCPSPKYVLCLCNVRQNHDLFRQILCSKSCERVCDSMQIASTRQLLHRCRRRATIPASACFVLTSGFFIELYVTVTSVSGLMTLNNTPRPATSSARVFSLITGILHLTVNYHISACARPQ